MYSLEDLSKLHSIDENGNLSEAFINMVEGMSPIEGYSIEVDIREFFKKLDEE